VGNHKSDFTMNQRLNEEGPEVFISSKVSIKF